MERLVYLDKKAYESKFRAYGKSVSPFFNVVALGWGLGGGDGVEKVSFLPISGLKSKFTGFTGWWVSFKPALLKASFPEEFGCEKKVSQCCVVRLKASFPVNFVVGKEVSDAGGVRGVYEFRLKVWRETRVMHCNSYKITCVQGNSGRCVGLLD